MSFKKCIKCGLEKDKDKFKARKESKDGFRNECKICEEVYRKQRLSDPAKREKERNRLRTYRANQTIQQRRTYNDKCLDYYSRNKSDYTKRTMDRIAKKKMATPKWAESEWEQFLIKEVYNLAAIRQKALGIEMHVDHTVPLQSDIVCGLHCSANLQVVTAEYNRNKSNNYWEHMP